MRFTVRGDRLLGPFGAAVGAGGSGGGVLGCGGVEDHLWVNLKAGSPVASICHAVSGPPWACWVFSAAGH